MGRALGARLGEFRLRLNPPPAERPAHLQAALAEKWDAPDGALATKP